MLPVVGLHVVGSLLRVTRRVQVGCLDIPVLGCLEFLQGPLHHPGSQAPVRGTEWSYRLTVSLLPVGWNDPWTSRPSIGCLVWRALPMGGTLFVTRDDSRLPALTLALRILWL